MRMKLCVFQGTFNPIHNAHLRVGEYVCQKFKFDKILYIPAFIPPHKTCDINMAQHRLNMVKLATQSNKMFDVSDIEYHRQEKSYTLVTIQELYRQYSVDGKINFIIGTDAFEKIESWYKTEQLKDLVKFIVFIREENFVQAKYNYLKDKGYDFEFQSLPYKDISSTELREMIKNGEDISALIPKEVKDYIEENELYKN